MHPSLSVLVVLLAYVAAQDYPQYLAYRSPYQAPFYGDGAEPAVINAEDPRLFRPTTTTTTTLTATFTCTSSIATACRKRRGILYAGEEEEQFPIAPSAVEGVEPTQVPSREARAADPQVLLISPPFAYQQPQSGFHSDSYQYRPVALPFYASRNQQPAAIDDQRFLLNSLQSAITATVTSTAFTITTFTLNPICSVAGTIAQCPTA